MKIIVKNNVDINELDLSVRAWNCLRRAKIDTVQDIVDNYDDLPKVRNLGQKCYIEVLEKIKPYVEFVEQDCSTELVEIDVLIDSLVDKIKSEAIKEFAERLKEWGAVKNIEMYVDNLVKEMVGDDK